MAESGAVDHLDEEVVGNGVERLRPVHRDGYGSARVLALIEARDHTSRDGVHGRGGRMPWFEDVLGGASAQRLHDGWRGGLAAPGSSLQCRAARWGGKSSLAHRASLPSGSGL